MTEHICPTCGGLGTLHHTEMALLCDDCGGTGQARGVRNAPAVDRDWIHVLPWWAVLVVTAALTGVAFAAFGMEVK